MPEGTPQPPNQLTDQPQVAQPQPQPKSPHPGSRPQFNAFKLLVALLVAGLIAGAYFAGQASGKKSYKATLAKEQENKKAQQAEDFAKKLNQWSAVGTIEKKNGDTLSIKNNKGAVTEAVVTSGTSIIQGSRKDVPVSELKTGQRVIAFGSKDGSQGNKIIRLTIQ